MTAWPGVVSWLLSTLPTLPGLSSSSVYDTDPVTADAPAVYAVVGRTSDDGTSGSYVRLQQPSRFLVEEVGSVRVHLVTRTGAVDPAGVRVSGFTIADALQTLVSADQTLGGVLGTLGTVALTVDVQSFSTSAGVAQSLVVSVNYTASPA